MRPAAFHLCYALDDAPFVASTIMKTISRILILGFIVGVIYFATLGRDDLYRFLNAAQDVIQTIANNYLKK